MFQLTNNLSVILFITTLINAFTTYVSWQRRKTRGGGYLALGMLGIALWTLSAGLDYAAVPIPLKVFFTKLEYTSCSGTLAFIGMFVLIYTGYGDWLKKGVVRAVFWFVPISIILLAWTNDWHGALWKGFTRTELGNNSILFEHGPAFPWIVLSGCLLILLLLLALWQASHKGPELSRRQARLLFAASLLAVAGNVIYLMGDQQLKGVDWSPIIYSVLGSMFILALYGTRLMDLVPIARYTLIEHMSESVLVLDEHNRVVDFNLAAQVIFNLNYSQLGEKIGVLLSGWPEITGLSLSAVNATSQLTIPHKDGTSVFDMHLTLFTDSSGKPYGKLIMFSDVTKHHQSEQALGQRLSEIQELNKNLQESQAQVVAQQRRLAKQEERRRLGRNMHDSVNQSIHSLMLFTETLVSLLDKDQIVKAKSVAERIQESGRRALKETRLLVFETQSQEPDEITDLVAALRDRFNFVENRVGVQTDIILDGTLAFIPSEWNENLYWIAIEALNNALKHAQTNKIRIHLRCNQKHLEMDIGDRGVGFNPALPHSGGMGMRTMRERAELLGGQLSVNSSPGHGTNVSFRAEIQGNYG